MTADLAVVGGGVIGCFAAYQAVRAHPDWRVVLLERVAIGAGATGWSAGACFPLAATAAHRALVRDSAASYAALAGTAAHQFVRPVQMIYVAGPDRLAGLQERVVDAALRPVSDSERGAVARMLPGVRLAAGEELVTHDGHGFAVHARALAEGLAAEFAERAEIQLGQAVGAVEADGDGYRLLADGVTWSARRVVVASGPWALPTVRPLPGPGPGAGQRASWPEPAGARRKRVAALYTRLPVTLDDPLVYFLDDDLFVLPLCVGSALVSFYRDEWDTDPDAVDGRADDADLRAGIAALHGRSAAAAEAVTGGRAFCDLYTEHRLPMVSADPAMPGLAAVRGGCGFGVRLAPALAGAALRAVDTRLAVSDLAAHGGTRDH
ncbi:MAG: FAD-dependent oxidoreductase [Micromonosporaceae bacterium]|nr:FAD-dependent oxidoreductase [Micromonosporaceae bacterium]